MKKIVLEQLTQRGLIHLFNQKDFLTHRRKTLRNNPGANRYYAALVIFDMFILNAPN